MTSRRIRKRLPTAARILREQQEWRARRDAALGTVEMQPLIQIKNDHDDDCYLCEGDSVSFGAFEAGMRWTPWGLAYHEPVWEPAPLPINAAGDTRPGYICVHPLENGNGPCGGNVFDPDQEIGRHSCVVDLGDPGPLFGHSVGVGGVLGLFGTA